MRAKEGPVVWQSGLWCGRGPVLWQGACGVAEGSGVAEVLCCGRGACAVAEGTVVWQVRFFNVWRQSQLPQSSFSALIFLVKFQLNN